MNNIKKKKVKNKILAKYHISRILRCHFVLDLFLHCLNDSSVFADAVMRSLVRRLRSADHKIESLALLDVYGRVARTLIEMASRNDDEQLVIADKVSRQDIAKTVGASREMVSRVMKVFSESGHIEELADGRVLLHDHLMGHGPW